MSDEFFIDTTGSESLELRPDTKSAMVIHNNDPTNDTVFYDNDGNEYLRIGPDNVPEDVYQKFADWITVCMKFPTEYEKLQARVAELEAEINRLRDKHGDYVGVPLTGGSE